MAFDVPVPPADAGVPAREGTGPGRGSPAQRLQILSTEHWSLLASRQLAWTESFARAQMFLTTLTGSIVALALVAQVSEFGTAFVLFSLAVLPAVLVVGLGTVLRLGESTYHDSQCVLGMNRIRGAYLEIDPDVRGTFVMSPHDDERGMLVTMAIVPSNGFFVRFITATPAVVALLTSMVAGVIAGLALTLTPASPWLVATTGVVVGLLLMALLVRYALRQVRALQGSIVPVYPSPADGS